MALPESGWQREMLELVVLYRILECGDKIPVVTGGSVYVVIENLLSDMNRDNLIDYDENLEFWIVAEKGKKFIEYLVRMYDAALNFSIFGAVNMKRQLVPGDECDDEGGLYIDKYDPRFAAPDENGPQWVDMRIAMITWMAENRPEGEGGEFDPDFKYRNVFIQKLADGQLKAKGFWTTLRLGGFFKEIVEIVDSLYEWREADENSEEAAGNVMRAIYEAGQREFRKREGDECGECGWALAEFVADNGGEDLDACPNDDCDEVWVREETVENDVYECPKCKAEITAGQARCPGCNAEIDFSLPEGTVDVERDEVVEEEYFEEDCFGYGYDHYGYEPYGYYDPYNPWADVAVACVLWSCYDPYYW